MGTLADNTLIDLLSAGADAMSNMYEVHITPPGATGVSTPLKIRTKSFTPAVLNQTKYDVKYKTVTLPRPGSAIEGERSFEISFRLDSNFQVYKVLKQWQQIFFNPETGYVATDLSSDSNEVGQIEVFAKKTAILTAAGSTGIDSGSMIDSNDLKWKYLGVWVQKLTEPAFNTDSSDPQEVTATFLFSHVSGPYSNGTLV